MSYFEVDLFYVFFRCAHSTYETNPYWKINQRRCLWIGYSPVRANSICILAITVNQLNVFFLCYDISFYITKTSGCVVICCNFIKLQTSKKMNFSSHNVFNFDKFHAPNEKRFLFNLFKKKCKIRPISLFTIVRI